MLTSPFDNSNTRPQSYLNNVIDFSRMQILVFVCRYIFR